MTTNNNDLTNLIEIAKEENDRLLLVMATLIQNNMAIIESKDQLIELYIDSEFEAYPEENKAVFTRAIKNELAEIESAVAEAQKSLERLKRTLDLTGSVEAPIAIQSLEQLRELVFINYDALADLYSDHMIELEAISEKFEELGDKQQAKEIQKVANELNRYFLNFGDANMAIDVRFKLDETEEDL